MATTISFLVSRQAGVVMASTVGIAVGITSTVSTVFSLFLVPISTEFNVPRASVSAVLILIGVANALVYPVIGRLADRSGARVIVLSGLLLFVISIALASMVEGLFQLYVVYALIGLSGSVLGPILFTKIIAGWFDRSRGFFMGVIGGVGNGVGSAIMPVYVFMLISDYGWRVAYQGVAGLVFTIGFPVVFFLLRDPPAVSTTQKPSRGHRESMLAEKELPGLTFLQARATVPFWLLLISISLCSGCLLAVFIHIIPVLTDRGIAMADATAVLSIFAMVTVVGQISVGALLDKLSRPRWVAPLFLIASLGLALIVSASSLPLLMLSGVLMGCGLGAEFGLLPYCISRYFGLRDYGSISGVIYSVVAISAGVLPVLMDVVFDVVGSYDLAILLAAVGMLLGAIMIFLLPRFDALIGSGAKENLLPESQHALP
jgi:MFS family permease